MMRHTTLIAANTESRSCDADGLIFTHSTWEMMRFFRAETKLTFFNRARSGAGCLADNSSSGGATDGGCVCRPCAGHLVWQDYHFTYEETKARVKKQCPAQGDSTHGVWTQTPQWPRDLCSPPTPTLSPHVLDSTFPEGHATHRLYRLLSCPSSSPILLFCS